jgi:hypothetical protein
MISRPWVRFSGAVVYNSTTTVPGSGRRDGTSHTCSCRYDSHEQCRSSPRGPRSGDDPIDFRQRLRSKPGSCTLSANVRWMDPTSSCVNAVLVIAQGSRRSACNAMPCPGSIAYCEGGVTGLNQRHARTYDVAPAPAALAVVAAAM